VLIESSEELIVEMWMIGFDLMIQNIFTESNQLLLGAGLGMDIKVDGCLQLSRQFEVDDFVFTLQCGLQKLQDHSEGL
jgi:hypothetical protein